MGTVTQTRPRETVKIKDACEILGLGREVIVQMIALGYFTHRRKSPISDTSHRMLYVDELDRYLELAESGLSRDRVLAAMKQHRIEMGRLKGK